MGRALSGAAAGTIHRASQHCSDSARAFGPAAVPDGFETIGSHSATVHRVLQWIQPADVRDPRTARRNSTSVEPFRATLKEAGDGPGRTCALAAGGRERSRKQSAGTIALERSDTTAAFIRGDDAMPPRPDATCDGRGPPQSGSGTCRRRTAPPSDACRSARGRRSMWAAGRSGVPLPRPVRRVPRGISAGGM